MTVLLYHKNDIVIQSGVSIQRARSDF